ncbi:MAG: hypothetical protein R3B84_24275 [Zavarzinella sp.]
MPRKKKSADNPDIDDELDEELDETEEVDELDDDIDIEDDDIDEEDIDIDDEDLDEEIIDPIEDEDEDEDRPKKKKKPKAKAAPKKPRASKKNQRMKAVWVVYDNSNKSVETYPYNQKEAAEQYIVEKTDEKKSFFLQLVKVPLEEKK